MSNWCKRAAGAALILAGLSSAARIAPAQDSAAVDSAKPRKLFSSDSILAVTIAGDIKKYMSSRDSLGPWQPARLIAGDDTIRIGMRPRGHFRRKSSTCGFPPVALYLNKQGKGTTFSKLKKLKLVTTCWPGRPEYEEYLVQEYLLYRVYNLLTPLSFRARFANITYLDTAHADHAPIVTHGFFLEDDKDMAARNAGTIIAAKNAGQDDFDPGALEVMSLFEYMIANTDFSLAAEHNLRFVRTGNYGVVSPVAYDFDWSGAVNARYAKPDPSLPINSVRNRLWTSYCLDAAAMTGAIATFNSQRAAITALYTGNPLLDPKSAQSTLTYFDEFYQIINDPKKLSREMGRHCERS